MKKRFTKLTAMLLACLMLSALAVLPTGIFDLNALAVTVLTDADLKTGTILAPGDYQYETTVVEDIWYTMFGYSSVTTADKDAILDYNNDLGLVSDNDTSLIGGSNDSNGYTVSFTLPDSFLYYSFDTGEEVAGTANAWYIVTGMDLNYSAGYRFYGLNLADNPFAPVGPDDGTDSPENTGDGADPTAEDDYWKFWREQTVKVRNNAGTTLSITVPDTIDTAYVPTFFLNAMKDVHTNVDLTVDGEIAKLTPENLPKYHSVIAFVETAELFK